jgi:RNA polymerase-binding protein DksA
VPARGTATKSTARTTAAKTTVAKTTAVKTTAAKTTVAKTTAVKTTAAKAAAPPASRNARKTVKATAAKAQATAALLRSHKIAASTSTARTQRLRVRQDEKPWTTRELEVVRAGLEADVARLHAEISAAESDLAGLMRDAGDGAGDDQADAGTKTFEREQEISLANNAREMFEQCQHALERIIHGSYGICESCGNPIGKNRLLAFPRATLCMPCKSKQERR